MEYRTRRHSSPRPPAELRATSGAERLREDLLAVRRELFATRHPIYQSIAAIVLGLLAKENELRLQASFEHAWRTRTFTAFYERPLLLMAAMRADALQEGPAHPLYAAIAAEPPDLDAVTADAVEQALSRERLGVWSMMTTGRIQTNDATRAITWLWPASLAGCERAARPVALVDVGACAGLNLIADQLPLSWTEESSGRVLASAMRVDAKARLGFDTRPLQVQSDDEVRWMRACIWPGEAHRLEIFDAAVARMRKLSLAARPVIETLSASLVPGRLPALAAQLPPHGLTVVYQSLLWGYLDQREREDYRAGMLEFLQRAPRATAAWVELEVDDARRRLPASLTAHVRIADSVVSLLLGRMSQYPNTVEVNERGVAELRRALDPLITKAAPVKPIG